jgi:flagellar L-ring protein precursor FlgH
MKKAFFIAMIVALAGCETVPEPIVHQPMSAAPQPAPLHQANGAIFPTGGRGLLMFEDQRARVAGDTLTVLLEEKNAASNKSSTKAQRSSDTDYNIDLAKGIPLRKYLEILQFDADSKNDFEGKGEASSNNALTGKITVTVIEVLANGNLVVSGEKQVALNKGTEYIRLSGVVNPVNIKAGNTVSSTQVADARLEYRGSGAIHEAQNMGWLTRLFYSVMPF